MRRRIRRVAVVGILAAGSILTMARAEEHTVLALPNNTFDPAQLTIAPGDTVTWTNNGGFHNVRADDDSFRCANGCDDDKGDGSPSTDAWSFSLVFTEIGAIPYYCEIHGGAGGVGMSGVVDVEDAGPIFADGFESGDTSAWTTTVP